jgi:hypothetical protein
MRTLATALTALAVLAGVAVPAGAFDGKSFFERLQRNLP